MLLGANLKGFRSGQGSFLAKHLTEASLPEIGRQFGGKHHTTVLHSVEKIEKQRVEDKDLNRLLNKLTEQLGG